ncbi:hypothetical protein OAH41_00255 [Paracoccaceae bacterium]|nr:hypothetical protein [Paracoccaceae bacterium]
MQENNQIWMSWSELNERIKGREVILYGRSEDWLPKTLNLLHKAPQLIVDRNKKYRGTSYKGVNIASPDHFFSMPSSSKPFIVITSSVYDEIVDLLLEKNFCAGVDFCCCPEFRDFAALAKLRSVDKSVIVSSSDYLDKTRARSSAAGGGIFLYDLATSQYEKKVSGVYRQLTKIRDGYLAVEYVTGEIHIIDKAFKILDRIPLDKPNYCGISSCEDTGFVTVVNAATDSVKLLSLTNFSLVDEIYFSKSKNDTSSAHHLNDCCIHDGKLYITMFSLTGSWKLGIFDGALVQYDLNSIASGYTVLVSNAWMPHSPEVIDNEICYLDSMNGNFITSNQYVTAHFDYFARGLDGDGQLYCIGASENMYASRVRDSRGRRNIMVNAGFSIYDRVANISRFYPLMHNMNVHDLLFNTG